MLNDGSSIAFERFQAIFGSALASCRTPTQQAATREQESARSPRLMPNPQHRDLLQVITAVPDKLSNMGLSSLCMSTSSGKHLHQLHRLRSNNSSLKVEEDRRSGSLQLHGDLVSILLRQL